ncbi:MAG TPA: MGMT family protein [Reyranella sp.]|nr:MGMT family protein [Reyranella sp.]
MVLAKVGVEGSNPFARSNLSASDGISGHSRPGEACVKRPPKWPRAGVDLASRFPARKPLPAVTLKGDAAAEAICAVVRRIPCGWVATYGQVATMAGMPRRARLVGRVLQHLDSKTNVPWHRVVNAKGEVSFSLSRNGGDILQRRLLEKEGVEFDANNRMDLERNRWRD